MLSDEEWLIGYNYFFEDYLVYEDIHLIDYDGYDMVDLYEVYDALYITDFFGDIIAAILLALIFGALFFMDSKVQVTGAASGSF